MRPLPIADYLEHIGRPPGEMTSRREASPFRPRSLPSPQPRSPSASDRAVKADNAGKPIAQDGPLRTPWSLRTASLDPSARESLGPGGTVKTEDIAVRLAQAHAQGRAEGLAEAGAEAEARRAAEIAAGQEQALMERLEFQINEYAKLEGTMRSGLAEVEANIGAAVARILSPFLADQVVKRAVDELCKSVARLCAGGSPELITIRGPERLLALLRQRLADLPAEVDYVEDSGVEGIVEANATRIATELRPWAELLASLDA